MAAKKKMKRKVKRKCKGKKGKKLQKNLSLIAKQQQKEDIPSIEDPQKDEVTSDSANEAPVPAGKKESEGCLSTILKSQNPNINHRHKALCVLHNQLIGLEIQFQKDIHELEELYMKKYFKPLQTLRRILLEHQRNEEAAPEYGETVLETCKLAFAAGCAKFAELKLHLKCLMHTDHGLPSASCDDFWLNVFMHSDPILRDLVCPCDLDKLSYLCDVRTETISLKQAMSMESSECEKDTCQQSVGFELQFEFRPNPYFTNSVLIKRYFIHLLPDDCDWIMVNHSDVLAANYSYSEEWDADGEDSDNCMMSSTCRSSRSSSLNSGKVDKLMDYNGPQVVGVKGCCIKWIPNSACTLSARSSSSPSTSCEFPSNNKSFFEFFEVSWSEKYPDHEKEITRDYQIGSYIRDVVIPKAYSFYRRTDWKEREKDCRDQHLFTCIGNKYANNSSASSPTETPTNNYDDIDEEIPIEVSCQALQTIQSSEEIKREIFENNKLTESRLARSSICRFMSRSKTTSSSSQPTTSRCFDEVDHDVAVPQKKFCSMRDMTCSNNRDDGSVRSKQSFHDCHVVSNPFQKIRDTSERVANTSESRERMANVVNRVNEILKQQGPQQSSSASDQSPVMLGGPRSPIDEGRVAQEESVISATQDARSRNGEMADDEGNWSELSQQPSVNRAFERLKYDVRTRLLPKRCSETTVEPDADLTNSTARTEKIVFCDVSPYPSDGDDCRCRRGGADSPNPESESSGDSGDCCMAAHQTPSSTESEDNIEETMKGFERPLPPTRLYPVASRESMFGRRKPKTPGLSTGITPKQRGSDIKVKDDEYDSEAPPIPNPETCKQQ